MLLFGYILGFRPTEGPLRTLAAIALVVLFSYSFSWVTATLGLFIRNAEAVSVFMLSEGLTTLATQAGRTKNGNGRLRNISALAVLNYTLRK